MSSGVKGTGVSGRCHKIKRDPPLSSQCFAVFLFFTLFSVICSVNRIKLCYRRWNTTQLLQFQFSNQHMHLKKNIPDFPITLLLVYLTSVTQRLIYKQTNKRSYNLTITAVKTHSGVNITQFHRSECLRRLLLFSLIAFSSQRQGASMRFCLFVCLFMLSIE